MTYDADNRLVEIEKNQTTVGEYVYDGDGSRVKSVAGGVTTYYIGNYYEWRVETNGSTGVEYYYAGSQRVAMRVGTTLSYLFGDHLGSTSITTDASGNVSGELRYLPFGETRYTSGQTPTSFRYTGQREDSTINLYWYNSRWYDASLGRWAQPDSIIPNPYNPQSWDRFGYVLNNPVRYNDPSGHLNEQGAGGGGSMGEEWWNIRDLVYEYKAILESENESLIFPPLKAQSLNDYYSQETMEAAPYDTFIEATPAPNDGFVFPYTVTVTANWEEADYLDVVTDCVGIGADIATVAAPEAILLTEGIGGTVEGLGVLKNISDIGQGDQDASSMLTLDMTIKIIEENPLIKARFFRIVPILGVFGNGYSLVKNLDINIFISKDN